MPQADLSKAGSIKMFFGRFSPSEAVSRQWMNDRIFAMEIGINTEGNIGPLDVFTLLLTYLFWDTLFSEKIKGYERLTKIYQIAGMQ